MIIFFYVYLRASLLFLFGSKLGEKHMNNKKFGISTFFVAILLVGTLLVPVVSGKADGLSSISSENVGEKIIDNSPEFKVIKKTDTSNIVQIGDVLITYESDSKYTQANLEINNLKTKEVSHINYKISKKDGKFKTDIYQEGKFAGTVTLDYNLAEPGTARSMIDESSNTAGVNAVGSSTKTTLYTWDGIKFIKGSGIKYPHPDYKTYGKYDYDNFDLIGSNLTHSHASKDISGYIVSLPGGVIGAAIAARYVNIPAAVAAYLIGSLLSAANTTLLLDEYSCLWVWISTSKDTILLPVAPIVLTPVYAPKYVRIGPYTLWNKLGISDP